MRRHAPFARWCPIRLLRTLHSIPLQSFKRPHCTAAAAAAGLPQDEATAQGFWDLFFTQGVAPDDFTTSLASAQPFTVHATLQSIYTTTPRTLLVDFRCAAAAAPSGFGGCVAATASADAVVVGTRLRHAVWLSACCRHALAPCWSPGSCGMDAGVTAASLAWLSWGFLCGTGVAAPIRSISCCGGGVHAPCGVWLACMSCLGRG
jgi:hypothetical protein